MGSETSKLYGLGVSPGTGIIYVGLTSKTNTELLEKQDITWEACKAVSRHLMIQEHRRFVFRSGGKQFEMIVRELSSN